MAESLRDLVVSLSLDSNNFAANIKHVNALLKETKSEFELAKAGVQGFETSAAGSAAKLATLESTLSKQKELVRNYGLALQNAQNRLENSVAAQAKLKQQLADNNTELAKAKQVQSDWAKQVEYTAKAFGKNSAQYQAAVAGYQNATKAVTELTKEHKSLEDRIKANEKTIQNNADRVTSATTSYNNAKAAVKETEAAIAQLNATLSRQNNGWEQFANGCQRVSTAAKTFADGCRSVGEALNKNITQPIKQAADDALKASMDFETAFTTVRQVSNASESEYAEWTKTIKDLAETTGIASASIANTMAEASRLGVDNANLESFTESALALGQAFGMSATEAATSMARFFNIMGTSQSEVNKFGSATTYLANNYATTASEIMEMAKGLAGAGKMVGMSEQDILGVSTALTSLGITAGRGAMSFSQALIKMETSVATSDKYLDDFAKVCGMTADQFKQAWERDATGAFQSFLLGLSRMDEAGESTIAVLQDCGIKTMRLTDTLLRSAGAEEVIVSAIGDANAAWEQGTELQGVAAKRYATTAIKLQNLKNNFQNLLITIGDDLKPVFESFIEIGNKVINWLDGFEPSTRRVIETIAAVAASVGPLLLALGTLGTAVSKGAAMLGSFAHSVAAVSLGGGLTASVALGIAGAVTAVGVAAAGATTAFIKLVTGGYKVEGVLKDMAKAAKEWKDTVSDSFWNSTESGLSALGISEDAFKSDRTAQNVDQWLTGLIDVWTDGQAETNEIRDQWIDSFKSLTNDTRQELTNLHDSAAQQGNNTLTKQLETDMKTLDAMDKEVEALLKKRQNGLLTEEDTARLAELVQAREEIIIKYRLEEDSSSDGFQQIEEKVAAAERRAQALGEAVDTSVYQNATKAAAEGYSALQSNLDAEYDSRLANIQLIEDQAERESELSKLDRWYAEQHNKNTMDYAETLSRVSAPIFESKETQNAIDNVNALSSAIGDYVNANNDTDRTNALLNIGEISKNLNEGDLVDYYATLAQIQNLMSTANTQEERDAIQAMFPDINISESLTQLAALQQWLSNNKNLEGMDSLSQMFTDIGSEVQDIALGLDLTQLSAKWSEWSTNPGEVVVMPKIESYDDSGASTDNLKVMNLTAKIMGYVEESVDLSSLSTSGILATVTGYMQQAGIDTSGLNPDDLVGEIISYSVANGIDLKSCSPSDLVATVIAYEASTGADTSKIEPKDLVAHIIEYATDSGVSIDSSVLDNLTAYVTQFELSQGTSDNPITLEAAIKINPQKAVEETQQYLNSVMGDENNYFFDFMTGSTMDSIDRIVSTVKELGSLDHVEFPALSELNSAARDINPDEFTAIGKSIGAMMNYLSGDNVDPEVASQYVTQLQQMLAFAQGLNLTDMWGVGGEGILGGMSLEGIDTSGISPEQLASAIQGAIDGAKPILDQSGAELTQSLGDGMANADFSTEANATVANIESALGSATSTGTSSAGKAITDSVGQELLNADLSPQASIFRANVEEEIKSAPAGGGITDFLNATLDGTDTSSAQTFGDTVATSVGTGLSLHDFSSAAATMATGIMTAIAAGLSADTSASTAAAAAMDAVSSAISGASTDTSSIGSNLMSGITAGINAGRSGVIQAAVNAVQEAIARAKAAAQIHSPSRVMRDEVGKMLMRGMGVGIDQEAKATARTMANATRYMTNTASRVASGSTYNNQRTYNNQSTVTLNFDGLSVRDDQDVRSLAIELAQLTRRDHQSKGVLA